MFGLSEPSLRNLWIVLVMRTNDYQLEHASYSPWQNDIANTDVLYYMLTGGNIFHGSMGLDSLFLMRPVKGW